MDNMNFSSSTSEEPATIFSDLPSYQSWLNSFNNQSTSFLANFQNRFPTYVPPSSNVVPLITQPTYLNTFTNPWLFSTQNLVPQIPIASMHPSYYDLNLRNYQGSYYSTNITVPDRPSTSYSTNFLTEPHQNVTSVNENMTEAVNLTTTSIYSIPSQVQQTHTEEQQGTSSLAFKCSKCPRSFKYKSSWKRHEFLHTGQRPHKCKYCGFSFKLKHHLQEHLRKHTKEKPFQCSKCLRRFMHSGSYSQHKSKKYCCCVQSGASSTVTSSKGTDLTVFVTL